MERTDASRERQDQNQDAVNEVLEIACQEIEPPPAFGAGVRSDFIQGVGKVRDRFVIILNMDAALSVDDIGDHQKSMVSSPLD